MPSGWNLSYWRYMIDDGCPDVAVGQILCWLVEFWTKDTLVLSEDRSKNAIEAGDHRYMVTGEVLFLSDSACVIDFGLKAIGNNKILPSGVKQGDFVSGEINLGFPLSTEVVPAEVLMSLEYEWEVERVLADLTPYLEVRDEFGSQGFYRDSSQVSYREVTSTEALHADSYVLRCCSKAQLNS